MALTPILGPLPISARKSPRKLKTFVMTRVRQTTKIQLLTPTNIKVVINVETTFTTNILSGKDGNNKILTLQNNYRRVIPSYVEKQISTITLNQLLLRTNVKLNIDANSSSVNSDPTLKIINNFINLIKVNNITETTPIDD